jgi:hypothetical protein
VEVKVADEVWVATALLHRENPGRDAFGVAEIVERAAREKLHPTRRPGVMTHASRHCVANKQAKPNNLRMLTETGRGKRRLYRPGDPVHPSRTGKTMPSRQELPPTYWPLLDWYDDIYAQSPASESVGEADLDELDNGLVPVEATPDWLWEGSIQERVAEYLRNQGWRIVRIADTASKEPGVDIRACKDGRTLSIEVKGYPTNTTRTAPATQARQWYSHALLKALDLYQSGETEVALAFPDKVTYKNLIARTRRALVRLNIGVYVVDASGQVQQVMPHDPAQPD